MDASTFFSLINSIEGTYLDLNFKEGQIANLILNNTETPRNYMLVGDPTNKSFYRRVTDIKNNIINLNKGAVQTPDSRFFNVEVSIELYYKPSIINLGDSSDLLEHILRCREDGTLVIIEELSESVLKFLEVNSLEVKFVSEYNFYYIVKGNQSRKSVNTLASKVNAKVGRDPSPNLT